MATASGDGVSTTGNILITGSQIGNTTNAFLTGISVPNVSNVTIQNSTINAAGDGATGLFALSSDNTFITIQNSTINVTGNDAAGFECHCYRYRYSRQCHQCHWYGDLDGILNSNFNADQRE